MKRAVIIHGWGGNPAEGWLPWLATELTKQGYQVITPLMPHTDHPIRSEWLATLEELVGAVDTETHFFGHSLGCYTIAKYLESRPIAEKAGKVIFVAGFSGGLPIPEIANFFNSPLNWPKIKSSATSFSTIYSERDPYVPVEFAQEFQEKLGAKLILCNDWQHFSGSEGIKELPILLTEFHA